MTIVHEGQITAADKQFALVVSRFNSLVTKELLSGALDCIRRHGGDESKQHVYWVPGAFEIPQTARLLVAKGEFDGIICLGAVIRGATPHFEFISAETARGIAAVAHDASIPVIFGVLTPDTLEQALERAGSKAGNKGWDAALTAIEMAQLLKEVQSR